MREEVVKKNVIFLFQFNCSERERNVAETRPNDDSRRREKIRV